MKLVITEKPSVGQAYARVLGAGERRDGYLEGGGYIVSWCIGHLVELAEPQDYDGRYAKWRREDLPIIPQEWKYRASESAGRQLGILRELMRREDVEGLVNCCDAGREGELIFRLAYKECGCAKPFERLWISSMEDSAIREGFESLKPGGEYDSLYEAALCRECADWLVGINATRLFSCLYGQTMNVGRVMTPTLAMVVLREAEVRGFSPEPFYSVRISSEGLSAAGERMEKREDAEAAAMECREAGRAIVTKAEKRERREKAPALYDLTTLQRDANRLLGYTAQQTLDYAQSLYEKKLLTSPRTDSRHLTDDMGGMLPGLAAMVQKKCGIMPDDPVPANAAQVLDGSKVSDHHAIIPTMTLADADPSQLPPGEMAVLSLVATRLVCALAEPCRYLESDMELECAGHSFRAKGRKILSPGWRAYAGKTDGKAGEIEEGGGDGQEIAEELPDLGEGEEIAISGAEAREGATTPPRRYTEDRLLAAMEAAGAGEIPEDAERRGIGTPATRAGIIEKLVQKGFVERRGSRKAKTLVPTAKGEALVTIVPEEIQSPSLTAEWEEKLLLIERGGYAPERFMEEISSMVKDLVRNTRRARDADALLPPRGTPIGPCPACGSEVMETPKGYFCSNGECRFAIWNDSRYFESIGKGLTPFLAGKLLKEGKVMMRGCKSKRTGKGFDAMLLLSVSEDGKPRFSLEFEKKGKSGGSGKSAQKGNAQKK